MVGKLVLWPFVVLAFLIVARDPMLDDWYLPLPLWVLLVFVLLGLIAHSVVLRLKAGEMKQNILERLCHGFSAMPVGAAADRQQLDDTIKDIERETSGALGPWSEDPILKAIAILLAGPGGIVAVDQLLNLMR